MDIDALLAEGENLTTEFKRSINDKDLVRAVACMANGQGGVLLVGVDDDGTAVGFPPRHGDTTEPHRVAALIQNLTDPPLPARTGLTTTQGHDVLWIEIPAADPGPVGTKDGVFTRRALDAKGEPQCLPMSVHEIASRSMLTRGQDYANAPALDATMSDLDPGEFDRYRAQCALSGDSLANASNEDILMALGLTTRHADVTLGAVLLFGREEAVSRWTPNAEVLFQDLRRSEPPVNERFIVPLIKAAEELTALVDSRNTVTEVMVGMTRVEIPLIPALTRREAVANALVHRDYSAVGPTVVQLNDERFAVTNPGGFPPGVTTSNILEQSRPRSPILADAFKRAGLVERRGGGVNDMFASQIRAGREVPDYSLTTTESVTVAVSLGTADLDLARFLVTWENEHQQPLSLTELRVIHQVKEYGTATAADLADDLHLSVAAVRSASTRLVEAGLLDARGHGRGRRHLLTPAFYDAARDRPAYVRIKGADQAQQERMVLDYVDAYGQITRGDAAGLCHVEPPQARTILKRLVDRGELRLVGERRTARYVRA
ncbi:DNA glycosylase AlkZ-like family protein [Kytococcus sp. Marseille-QA3725]